MYNLSDIKSIHLELTSKCQARCPQCGRFEFGEDGTFAKINPLLTDRNGNFGCLDEISLSEFIKWFPPKFVSQLNSLYVCGTFGEPTLAVDCLKILAYLRINNPNMILGVSTNGGIKSKEWWENVAKLNVNVIFGIDGLEDTHSLYRVNTDWKSIIKSARAFIDVGGNAEWQMLVFKHNEHQIYECFKLAKMLRFKSFRIEHTSRFGESGIKVQAVYNPKGEITHYLEPSSISEKNFEKINSIFNDFTLVEDDINCSAKKNFEIYVAANGDVLPCCYMESCFMFNLEDIEDYKNKIGLVKPNLHRQTLKEVFDSQYFSKIESTWNMNPLMVCSKTCGKRSGTTCGSKFLQSYSINL